MLAVCVKVDGNAETRKILEEAFACLKNEKMGPVWYSDSQCLEMTEKQKDTIFIFEVFKGDAYKHIVSLGFRVFGPMCIVTSMACKQNIPRRHKPIYNLAMKDVIMCLTNISTTDRAALHEKVELMGGEFRRDFTSETTHLVAGAVGSTKYLVSGAQKTCQIMLPAWVNHVWEKSQHEPVHGLDEQFQEYKCPIFYGCVITVSGLSSAERTEAKRLIEKEGGVYTGEMTVKDCTHLIINEPQGQKYRYAVKWAIHVVRSEWLYESIEKGYCQEEKQFALTNTPPPTAATRNVKTSTPERRSMANGITDLSNISMISMAAVNETANITNVTNNMTRLDYDDLTQTIDLTKVPTELFLDGCKLYLSGFRGAKLEKLRKIINSGGGSRFNQITDNLTHVVVGEKIARDHEQIHALASRPHVVNCQWLVECYKQEKIVDETAYVSPHAPPAPTSPADTTSTNKKSVGKKAAMKPASHTDQQQQDDMHEIMSQYLTNNQTNGDDTTIAPEGIEVDNDQTQDPAQITVADDGMIFDKKTFVFYGFDDHDEQTIPTLTGYIKECGGTVVKSNTRRIPDYAIVPIDGYPVDRTVNCVATKEWLLMCVERTELLDVHSDPLFTPMEIIVENQPLRQCVISVSGYAGTERDSLVSIAEVLGATCQEYFVRVKKNELLPSTHLIVNAAGGTKFNASQKWGIPAISKMWVIACAKSGKLEDVNKYLVVNMNNDTTTCETDTKSVPSNPTTTGNRANPVAVSTSCDQKKSDSSGANKSAKDSSGVNRNIADSESNQIGNKSINRNFTAVDSNHMGDGSNAENVADSDRPNARQNASARTTRRSDTAGRQSAVNLPDFSATGDTDALMMQLNTQGEQPQTDADNTVQQADDKTVQHAQGDANTSSYSSSSKRLSVSNYIRKTVETSSCSQGDPDETHAGEADEHELEVGGDGVARDDNYTATTSKPETTTEKPSTPALRRLMRNLESNPPPTGTPALCKQSAREELTNKAVNKNLQTARGNFPASLDTPPLTRFMRNLEKNPPLTGTPALSKQSAFEKLEHMGGHGRLEEKRGKTNNASQKENVVATATPVQNRVKELLVQEGGKAVDTPSKFLNPNVRFIPKFDTEELLDSLRTPDDVRNARAKKRESLSNEELYEVSMNKAMANVAKLRDQDRGMSQNEEDGYSKESTLQGVIITVARKLAKDQAEYNEIVTSLGGGYRWTYDHSCTHFIFQGRQNDTARDFKQAKSKGLKIVSPHWLYMCMEQNCKVDETLYPHTFNPNLSLSVVATKRTPMRTPRSTRRQARVNSKTDSKPGKPILIQDDEHTAKTSDDGQTGQTSDVGRATDSDSNAEMASKTDGGPVKNLQADLKSPDRSSTDDETKAAGAMVETGGSLEMREVLSKQLEDVMAESKGKKKRKSKRLNCSGQLGTPDASTSSNTSRSRRTDESVQKNDAARTSREETVGSSQKHSSEMAPSQSVHVVWDDPMGRLEQEKLAHKLERANSPTQDVDSIYDLPPEDAQYSDTEDEPNPDIPQFAQQHQTEEKTTPKQGQPSTGKTPTPEAPSIAFPTKTLKVTPPRPVTLDDGEADVEQARQIPIFIMSGMTIQERDSYGTMVEELGGKVLESANFDISCTHLVINKVARNEKFLASLASGKWVLHKSYFDACREEQQFVKEDFYEWGNTGTMSLVKNMENNVRLLAAAARDWRINLQQQKLTSPGHYGAFSSWRVILNCDKAREGNYSRLLAAGGATVLNIKPPYPSNIDATHALLEPHKVAITQEDLETLLHNGCLCLKPDYISGFLCNPEVDVLEYTPPEVGALQTAISSRTSASGRKRKGSANDTSQKRSKRR